MKKFYMGPDENLVGFVGNSRPFPPVIPWSAELKAIKPPTHEVRLLVLLPTRGRSLQALRVASTAICLAHNPKQMDFVFVGDVDDSDFGNIVRSFSEQMTFGTYQGEHRSKIEACNCVPPRSQRWDVLVSLSDDMVCMQSGWDEEVRGAMLQAFPAMDGLLVQNDGHQGELCTLPIMGRRLYEKLGYVYNPAYKSLFADNELTDVALKINKCAKVDKCWFRHDHPAWGTAENDELYRRNDALFNADKKTYESRKKDGFFEATPTLSILIPSLAWRHEQLKELVDKLYEAVKHPFTEILIDVDDGEKSIGRKRNDLLNKARGEYVCFIDDDDMVSDEYVLLVHQAVEGKPDVVSWWGEMSEDGVVKGTFLHSLKREREIPGNRIGTHRFMHLNPIRRECIGDIRFPEESFGEDQKWCERVWASGRVKTEVYIGGPHYFYRYQSKGSSCSAIGGNTWAKRPS